MIEQAKECAQLLRSYCNEPWMTIGAKPFAVESATLIEQQAARIAELEKRPYHYIGRDGKTVTAASLEDRAEAAEAEVKRLRDALNKSWYEVNALGGCPRTDVEIAVTEAINAALEILTKNGACDPLRQMEPHHD